MRFEVRVLAALLAMVAASPLALGQTTQPAAFPKIVDMLNQGVEPVRIVCFGDSVTGVYYHTGGRRAYADMLGIALKRLYPSAKVEVINAGVSGHTTVDGLARIDKDVLAHKPHLVTVMFGLNDITRVAKEDYANNLSTIIEKCRAVGSEVLLCTPNAVFDTESRPSSKLEDYIAALHDVAKKQNAPVAECYAGFQKVREQDAGAFGFLMSDEIHPNMDGHKYFAEMMAETITGKPVSLSDEPSPFPAIPKTLALLKEGKPVRVYAMPPYDALIADALRSSFPSASLVVTPWQTDGKTVPQLEEDAKAIRGIGVDLVVVAIPIEADADTPDQYGRSYRWVMNHALSFGYQEWDVVAFAPSLAKPELSPEQQAKDEIARRLIRAQDLGTVVREGGNTTPAAQLLADWVKTQTLEPGK
ncbi:MAG: SGNH/GDSL hydrolase family protein [Candidatus Hydrogenedentes bacterium]|nr:SGNH/GDSL hydrolase family protein [Candidatus Hydrogenedentota bacterium]